MYGLFLGTRPAVVISGLKNIKEALVTKGSDFAGRPQDMFVNDAIKTNGKTHWSRKCSVLSDSGSFQKIHHSD